MAEEQSAHRRKLERQVVTSGSITSILGQLSALVVTILTIRFAAAMLNKGHSAKAVWIVLSAIGALAGTFIYGKHVTTQQRRAKAERERQAS